MRLHWRAAKPAPLLPARNVFPGHARSSLAPGAPRPLIFLGLTCALEGDPPGLVSGRPAAAAAAPADTVAPALALRLAPGGGAAAEQRARTELTGLLRERLEAAAARGVRLLLLAGRVGQRGRVGAARCR